MKTKDKFGLMFVGSLLTLLLLGSMGLISAVTVSNTLSGGECGNVSYPYSNPKFQIFEEDTTMNMSYFNWTLKDNEIEYCVSLNANESKFKVRWFNEEKESQEKEDEEGGGGTSGGGIYVIPKEDISEGIERTLKNGRSINFAIESDHKLTIKNVSEDTATFLIESDPIELIIKENETKSECISQSEKVEITNLHIVGDYAHFTLKSINASDCVVQDDEPKQEDNKTENESQESNEEKKSDSPKLLLIIITILVVAGVYLLIKTIKSKRKSNEQE